MLTFYSDCIYILNQENLLYQTTPILTQNSWNVIPKVSINNFKHKINFKFYFKHEIFNWNEELLQLLFNWMKKVAKKKNGNPLDIERK